MIIKAYYAGGRIDVFDTDHLIDAMPQKGNLLTNYTLDLSDVNGESLWLRTYYYEAAEAFREEGGGRTTFPSPADAMAGASLSPTRTTWQISTASPWTARQCLFRLWANW